MGCSPHERGYTEPFSVSPRHFDPVPSLCGGPIGAQSLPRGFVVQVVLPITSSSGLRRRTVGTLNVVL